MPVGEIFSRQREIGGRERERLRERGREKGREKQTRKEEDKNYLRYF